VKRLAYSAALGLGICAAAPWLAARLARGRYRRIAAARLGLGSAWLPPEEAAGGIWLHALSVGEVASALPLLEALGRRFPELPLCLSAATAQGLAVARQRLAGSRVQVFVRPLELPWAVYRLLRRLRPRLFVLVEGDIWPYWNWVLKERGVPCLLVNDRVSPRTFKGYRRLGPLARELFAGFDRVLAQTEVDHRRLLAVGVPPEKVAVGGNLKFDSAPDELDAARREETARELGLAGRPVLAAGSTHPGEDEVCLDAFKALLPAHPDLALLLAPREVSRGGELLRLARRRGLWAARVSQGRPPAGTQVVILDVLGRLARSYACCRAAFVGGSLVPVGGHNLLEPAVQGVPVLFGPITHNFLEMARQLEECGGGRRVSDAASLAAAWREILEQPPVARRMGRAARDFCREHRGAVQRAVAEAAALLEGGGRA